MLDKPLIIGGDWYLDVSLTDDDGDEITSLTKAWFSIYNNSGQLVQKDLTDSEVTFTGNILTLHLVNTVTELYDEGRYLVTVKVELSSGDEDYPVFAEPVKVAKPAFLYDDH